MIVIKEKTTVMGLATAHIEISEFQKIQISTANYLRKIVTRCPFRFIRRYRLEKALNLFYNGERSVATVAQCVGFRDIDFFNKCFQEEFSVTPQKLVDQLTRYNAIR